MCKKIDELIEENVKLKEELARLEAEKHTIECRFEVSEDTLNCIRSCLRAAENDIDQLKAQLAEALVAPNTADLPGRIDRFLDSQPAVPKGDYAAPNQIADALESLEWKGCSIGHKVILANAVAALRATQLFASEPVAWIVVEEPFHGVQGIQSGEWDIELDAKAIESLAQDNSPGRIALFTAAPPAAAHGDE